MRGATAHDHVPVPAHPDFNPRSSCEERHATALLVCPSFPLFQSTLLMRGATIFRCSTRLTSMYFNPRSSCEERLFVPFTSIFRFKFQSTLLMRGATYARVVRPLGKNISIHAPHARSDAILADVVVDVCISIHAPHARSDDDIDAIGADVIKFQSTLLMRGATASPPVSARMRLFQSTLLMRGATSIIVLDFDVNIFQSTLLMRGATCALWCVITQYRNFNPRSSCEERHDAG